MLLFICQDWFFWNCFITTPEMKVLPNQRLYSSCTYLCRILCRFVPTAFTATIWAAPYIPVISKLRGSKGISDGSGCIVNLIFEHLKTQPTLKLYELWTTCAVVTSRCARAWPESSLAQQIVILIDDLLSLFCPVPLWDRLVDIYPPTLDGSACLETSSAKPAISIETAWHKEITWETAFLATKWQTTSCLTERWRLTFLGEDFFLL